MEGKNKPKKTTVIAVRFTEVGKIHYFKPNNMDFKNGENVIVETIRGVEFGTVIKERHGIEITEKLGEIKNVIRKATKSDAKKNKKNNEEKEEIKKICIDKIKTHKLDMNLIDVEYTFDRTKLLFYFTAEDRVDFRNLVKDLAGMFRTRIELRQVGVRDEAKIINGIGKCGRMLCCATFLTSFQVVSLKMAKEQRISLNPNKISGSCGRLMCCLKYEEEVYKELSKIKFKEGDIVETKEGRGEIISILLLKGEVKVKIRDKKTDEVVIREVKIKDIETKER